MESSDEYYYIFFGEKKYRFEDFNDSIQFFFGDSFNYIISRRISIC